jgi:hypothetical protein
MADAAAVVPITSSAHLLSLLKRTSPSSGVGRSFGTKLGSYRTVWPEYRNHGEAGLSTNDLSVPLVARSVPAARCNRPGTRPPILFAYDDQPVAIVRPSA